MKPGEFWKTPTSQVIRAMKASGNRPGVIAQWIALAQTWAEDNKNQDAEAMKAWLKMWKLRPFYTARELAPMWPALCVVVGASKQAPHQMSPSRLKHMLEMGELPKLQNADRRDTFFEVNGELYEFFIVEHLHRWRDVALTQEQMNDVLQN